MNIQFTVCIAHLPQRGQHTLIAIRNISLFPFHFILFRCHHKFKFSSLVDRQEATTINKKNNNNSTRNESIRFERNMKYTNRHEIQNKANENYCREMSKNLQKSKPAAPDRMYSTIWGRGGPDRPLALI